MSKCCSICRAKPVQKINLGYYCLLCIKQLSLVRTAVNGMSPVKANSKMSKKRKKGRKVHNKSKSKKTKKIPQRYTVKIVEIQGNDL